MNSAINTVCKKIELRIVNNKNCSIDPMTFILITNIVLEAIKLLYQCKQDKNTLKIVNFPRIKHIITLKRILRKQLKSDKYLFEWHHYLKAVRDVGRNIDQETLDKIYDEYHTSHSK